MSFSLFLSKFKSLTPVVFVASSVLITIKLLTTQTPSLDNSINVALEEDIKTVSYEDEIVIPEPEIQEAEEEKIEEEDETSEEDGGGEESEDEEVDEEEEAPKKDQAEQKQEEQQNTPKRKFIDNGIGGLLSKLLSPKNKG